MDPCVRGSIGLCFCFQRQSQCAADSTGSTAPHLIPDCTRKIRRTCETAFWTRKTGRKAAAIQAEAWTVEHCVLIYADRRWTPRPQSNCGAYRCGSLISQSADSATAATANLCRSGASRDQAFSCSIHPIGCCLGAPFFCWVLGAKQTKLIPLVGSRCCGCITIPPVHAEQKKASRLASLPQEQAHRGSRRSHKSQLQLPMKAAPIKLEYSINHNDQYTLQSTPTSTSPHAQASPPPLAPRPAPPPAPRTRRPLQASAHDADRPLRGC